MPSPLSDSEYRSLSEQKADDYRALVGFNPSLLATTGAIFAAGLAKGSTVAIVLSPLPMLLGVYQLIGNTELQLQLITYLAVFGPTEGGRWERDVAEVRPQYWERRYPQRLRRKLRVSAWMIWAVPSWLLTEILVAFPWITHLRHGPLAFIVGSIANCVAFLWFASANDRMQARRELWTECWRDYLGQHRA